MRRFKKIKVMPDFCSSGIWENDFPRHVCMIDYEDLGLPRKLVKEFEAWIELYDRGSRRNYDGLRQKAVPVIYREGLRLAREIKRLFPKVEVEYWAELGRCKLKKMKIRRCCILKGKIKDDKLADAFIVLSNKVISETYIPESLRKVIRHDRKTGRLVPR